MASLLYDRLEEVRVEAVGGERMAGVKANLASAYRARQGQPQAGERGQDATMAEIVDLYARERLLGFEPSQPQRKLMETWGEWLDTRVAEELPALATTVADQEAFARQVRELLAHLGLSEQLTDPPDDSDREDQDEDSEQPPAGGDEDAEGDGEGQDQQQSAAQAERDAGGEDQSEVEAMASDSSEESDSQPGGEDEFYRGAAHQPAAVPAARRRGLGLQGVRDPVRRGGHGRGAVRPQRAHPPARPARPVADPLPGHDRPHGQPAAAQADGAAAALLVVRPRRGHPGHRPPVAGGDQPRDLALVQDGGRDRVPRHRGLAADRQFGLDARPADRGGGHECRHPGPHARALRGQGRDPGLHHAGLEGRAVARSPGCGPASPAIPAGSTTCATSSTSRRMRPGVGRAARSA